MIFRFNRYSKRNYIKKLLKNHEYFYLNKDENINKITDYILETEQKNYKKYIEHLYLDKYLENYKKNIENMNKDDFQINIIKRTCYFPPCLNSIIGSNNYCSLHNENSV